MAADSDTDLAVGLFASIGRDRLADELLAFARQYPLVGLGVHEMPRAALLPALEAGELALAVMPGGTRPELRSAPLWDEQVMLAMNYDHPFARQASVAPANLSDAVFVVSRQQHGGDMHRFLSHCISPLAPALNSVLLDLGPAQLMARVAAGNGLALICASHTDGLGDGVVLRPIDAPGATFPVRAWWKAPATDGPLSTLIDMLLAHRPG